MTLLCEANPPRDLEKARMGILMPCVRKRNAIESKRSFLDAVLEPLCRQRPEMAVDILESLAVCDDEDLPEPRLVNVPALWHAMFCAMRQPEKTKEFLDRALEHIAKDKTDARSSGRDSFSLRFESSQILQKMYVDFFKQQEGHSSDMDRHEILLADSLARTAVFKHLISRQEEVREHDSLLRLLYFTWWSVPMETIPLELQPTPTTWSTFKEITKRTKPSEDTLLKGMSVLARFATAPHTLPASILNTLHAAIVGENQTITTKTYVLAQKDSTTYPVYAFRTHFRTLPEECLQHIVEICKGPRDLMFQDTSEKMCLLFPLTDSGVSKKTVEHNLNILVNISQAECSINDTETCKLQAQLFLTTLIWFESAGFDMNHLKQMCTLKRDKDQLTNNRISLSSEWEKKDFAQSLVYQSLPVYVDVRFCSGRDDPLFECHQESVTLTMSWLSMLTMHYKCSQDAPRKFYDYTAERNKGSAPDTSIPSKIVNEIFRNIAGVLNKKHCNLKLPSNTESNYHVILVLDDSMSMQCHWSALVTAVKHYLTVRRGKGMQDLVSIVIFNHNARIVCERMSLADCIQQLDHLLEFVGGSTNFRSAILQSLELLRRKQDDMTAAMLFMSDGESQEGTTGESEMRIIASEFRNIKVTTMAFGTSAGSKGETQLKSLADIAEGTLCHGTLSLQLIFLAAKCLYFFLFVFGESGDTVQTIS